MSHLLDRLPPRMRPSFSASSEGSCAKSMTNAARYLQSSLSQGCRCAGHSGTGALTDNGRSPASSAPEPGPPTPLPMLPVPPPPTAPLLGPALLGPALLMPPLTPAPPLLPLTPPLPLLLPPAAVLVPLDLLAALLGEVAWS